MQNLANHLEPKVITDKKGRKKVVLDLEKYQELLKLAHQTEKKETKKTFDWGRLIGMALKAPLNPNPKFKTTADVWKDDL